MSGQTEKVRKTNTTIRNARSMIRKQVCFCVFLVAAVSIVLAGCKQGKQPETIQPESETADVQESSADIEYVVDAYSVEKPYYGYEYDFLTDKVSDHPVDAIATYRIPKINMESEDVRRINQELYDEIYPLIQESIEKIDLTGEIMGVIMDIEYFWCVNGDILSLVEEVGPYGHTGTSPHFLVYNISIQDMRELSNEEIYTEAGFTRDEFYKAAREALGSKFWEGQGRNSELSPGLKDLYNSNLEKTISEENINASRIYLNDKGQLCLVGRKYTVDSSHSVQVNLNDYELVQDYDVPLGD